MDPLENGILILPACGSENIRMSVIDAELEYLQPLHHLCNVLQCHSANFDDAASKKVLDGICRHTGTPFAHRHLERTKTYFMSFDAGGFPHTISHINFVC